jgi:hypothetical protein
MGCEKVFTIVNMKFRNICVYTVTFGFGTSDSSNIQVHPPSSMIMVLLMMSFLDRSCLR